LIEYSLSYDVLDAVIEKITGKTLGAQLGDVLFKPQNMPDTGFQVATDMRGRLAHPLPINPIDGKPQHIFGFDNPARFFRRLQPRGDQRGQAQSQVCNARGVNAVQFLRPCR
jgi:CubicO group peptidase (beta-lactamase class C family)